MGQNNYRALKIDVHEEKLHMLELEHIAVSELAGICVERIILVGSYQGFHEQPEQHSMTGQ